MTYNVFSGTLNPTQSINLAYLPILQRVHEKKAPPPKYNGLVFEILGKHHGNFYNRI